MQAFVWVIIIGVILILAIVFLGVGLKFYGDWQGCVYEVSPWCYNDWRCPNFPPTDPRYYPAKNAFSIAATKSQGSSYEGTVPGMPPYEQPKQ